MRASLPWACATLAALVAADAAPAAEARQPLPLPEIVVSKTPKPPIIDGRMEPGEWDFATAGTGFHAGQGDPAGGYLAHNQTVFWVTYDEQHLYVCLKNYRAADQALLGKNGREQDDLSVGADDGNEIWFSPPAAMPTTYQILFNSYPAAYDEMFITSIGHRSKGWSSQWELAVSETVEYWIVEARTPITPFGADRIKGGDTWRALFATHLPGYLKDGGYRRWGPWVTPAFKDVAGHDYLHFQDTSPVVQVLDLESVFTGKPELSTAVTAPAKGKCKVEVSARFGPGPAKAAGDLVLSRTVELSDGRHEAFTLAGDLAALNLPKAKLGRPAVDVPAGYCEITATAEGKTLYRHVVRFGIDGYRRVPPAKLADNAYDTPFGVEAYHAPLSRKLVVKVDRLYMRNRDAVAGGTSRLMDKGTGKEVARAPLLPFRHDYSHFTLDLKDLMLPVETEAAWAEKEKVKEVNKLIAEANAELKRIGQQEIPLKPDPGPFPKAFALETTLTDEAGKDIARVETPVSLMDYSFEWLGHDLGISDNVIPPWTPLRWQDERLSLWNKIYRLNALGMAEDIVNSGAPLLAAPMRLIVTADGKETAVAAALPRMKKLCDGYAELEGRAAWGDLDIVTETRVDFDGFVKNRMTLNPLKPVKLDHMALVVTLPSAVAQFMAASPGGHCSVGPTPRAWTSRSLASGSLYGSFVPYVFLTDSEQGFCWCADSDRGWVINPLGDALTVTNDGVRVRLRVHFVQQPATLDRPVTIEYAWMVTPQKPRPPDWRAYAFSGTQLYPQMRPVMLGSFGRRKVWDYYCSPYPTNMALSRLEIQRSLREKTGVATFVGHAGDSLGWWEDYKGRDFSVLAADWSDVPGVKGLGRVTRARGPNDYELWHWDRWIRHGGLEGVYFDINSLQQEWNFLAGTAYFLPDGRIQPGFSYLGQREYMKRLRYVFESNGKHAPYLWHHSTGSCPVFSWLTDVLWEAENVHPTGREADYIAVYPPARFRTLGMGASIGAVPIFVCANHDNDPFNRAQFIGWTALHDTIEGSQPWNYLAAECELWQGSTRFLPYWKPGLGVASSDKDVWVSAHVRPAGGDTGPGAHAVLWVVNTAPGDRSPTVTVDPDKLGLPAKRTRAFDAETGAPCDLKGGRLAVGVVPARLWRAIRLQEVRTLKQGETFAASFDSGEVASDEALGYRYAIGRDVSRAFARGRQGLGADLDTARTFWTRHHLAREAGWIEWQMQTSAPTEGALLVMAAGRPATNCLARLGLGLARGKLALDTRPAERADPQIVAQADWSPFPGPGWHAIRVSWQGRVFRLAADGKDVLTATLSAAVPGPDYAPAEDVFTREPSLWHMAPATVTFGPLPGAVMDDLAMGRSGTER